nr:unnamed protein product [Digitaria exilis]
MPNKSSRPTVARNTSSLTTVLKSNINLGSVPGLPPKSKINSVTSGSAIAKDVVPTITTIRDEANGSVKSKNFLPHPQSSFGGPASTFAKPSALRMPSPSVGFFAQENAHVPHGNAAKRNVGRNTKALDRSRTSTILKDHLANLIPFSEEWLAVMESRGEEVLEQKTGAVQNSPPDKIAPEPNAWSPVKRKAQNIGPFECTKYPKSVRTSGAP